MIVANGFNTVRWAVKQGALPLNINVAWCLPCDSDFCFLFGGYLMIVVYKYMSVSRFAEHMEKYLEGKLYFAKWWDELNDPKEGKYIVGTVANDKSAREKFKGIKREVRVCSTSGSAENLKLWDTYAEQHTGVCIAIETDNTCTETLNADKLTGDHKIFNEVKYIPKLSSEDEINLNSDPRKAAIEILMKKLEKWQDEKEVRFLAMHDNEEVRSDGGMAKIGTVKGIILGSCFKDILTYTKLYEKLRGRNDIWLRSASLLRVDVNGPNLLRLNQVGEKDLTDRG